MKRTSLVLIVVAALLITIPAAADSVTYNGATFSLTESFVSGTTYQFVYEANFNGFTAGNQTTIDGIGFGTGGTPTITGIVLVSTTASGTWTPSITNLNNAGCSGGNANEVCLQVNPLDGNPTTTNADYFWTVNVTYSSTLPSSSLYGDPIRAWFGPVGDNGKGTGLMSCNLDVPGSCTVTQTPEPASMTLLVAGLLGIAGFAKRKLVR